MPKGRIRPTSDILKEALFNILPPMEGKSFLDLFAGTGSVGLEAMSRGAAKTVFIETNSLFIEAIKRNLGVCGFDSNYEIIAAPVEKGLKLLGKRNEQFNIIFADPPYEENLIKKTLYLLGEGYLISEGDIVIMQHSFREKLEMNADSFILTDQRRYSDTVTSFLKLNSRGQKV